MRILDENPSFRPGVERGDAERKLYNTQATFRNSLISERRCVIFTLYYHGCSTTAVPRRLFHDGFPAERGAFFYCFYVAKELFSKKAEGF